MKKGKLLAFVLALVMIVSLLAACGGAASSTASAPVADSTAAESTAPADGGGESEAAASGDSYSVLCLLNGSLGDKGFYDNAASGFYRLQDELGWNIKIIEMGRDETTYEGYFLDASESGEWDLIVTGTFSVKDLLQDIAVQFPEQKYMAFDISIDADVVTTGNVMGVTYMSNETGFMGGALAALMFDKSGDEKIDTSNPVLGFVGSMDSPNINDFLVGYMEGIQYVNPDLKLLTSYVGSFSDVPKCLEMTTQLYNQGAQIVYAPASQSILGAVQASADTDKYFLACDNDIWTITEGTDAELVSNVLSSTMKNVGTSIFDAAKGLMEGTYTVGKNYVLGIKDGAVGLADNANYQALVPEDIRTELDDISAKIASGEIVVGSAFGMETEEVAALRDGMKP